MKNDRPGPRTKRQERRRQPGGRPRRDWFGWITRRPGTTVAVVLLLVLVGVAYANSFAGELVLDNRTIIGRDTRLRACSWENLGLILTKGYWWPVWEVQLYRPLTTLSFLFNYSVLGGGQQPAGYHVLNLLLHAVNVLLVYAPVRGLLRNAMAAWFAAAVFAVHPLQTEVVTNIVGRADLLCSMFLLIGLGLHILSRRRREWQSEWTRLGLGLSALAAVMCKESGAVLIGLLLLYDLASIGRRQDGSWRTIVRDTLGGGRWKNELAVLPALVLLLGIRYVMAVESPVEGQIGSDNPIELTDFWTGRMTAVKVAGYYLRLLAWPDRLSCDYSYRQIPVFGWTFIGPDRDAWLGLAALAVLAAAAWVAWRKRHPLFFFWGLGFLCWLPVSNLLVNIGTIMGERFMYLSVAGFAAGVAAALLSAAPWGASHLPLPPKAARWLLAAGLGLMLAAFTGRTLVRNEDWHTEERLWTAAVSVCPDSYKTYKGLAGAILRHDPEARRLPAALPLLEHALAIVDAHPLPPEHAPTGLYIELGRCYARYADNLAAGVGGSSATPAQIQDYYDRAVRILELAATADRAHNERARHKWLAQGRAPGTIPDVGQAEIYDLLALVETRLHHTSQAQAACRRLCRIAPDMPSTYRTCAFANRSAGRPADAAVNYLEAMLAGDKDPSLWTSLTDMYAALGVRSAVLAQPGKAPIFNTRDPVARAHLNRACRGVIQNLLDARRPAQAEETKLFFIRRYQCQPSLFADLAPRDS
jgi:hypothetical protein